MHKLQKEGTIKMYWEAVIYLLESYNTDDAIPETAAEIRRLTQTLIDSLIEDAELLLCKALHWTQMYYE